MDQEPEPEVIRQQIDQTRSALTEKLETLETQVRGTVTSAKTTVEETIENVKGTVRDTVHTVKQTFDLPYQTERHPWAMFGGSVVAGYLVGMVWAGWPGARSTASTSGRASGNGAARWQLTAARPEAEQPGPARPGLLSRFLHQFDDEIEQVTELAIGAAMGALRDAVHNALPQYGPQIDQIMESATAKMGGKLSTNCQLNPRPSRLLHQDIEVQKNHRALDDSSGSSLG
jgi:hypothetical protein